MEESQRPSIKKIIILTIVAIVVFFAGWVAKNMYADYSASNLNMSIPLRLGGDKFTEPLLVCDANTEKESPNLGQLKNKTETLIEQKIKDSDISVASVYFRDLKTGNQMDINAEEKFYPASLRKVPLMIAALKTAEANPAILQKVSITIKGDDQNASQEIKPTDYAKVGQTYVLGDLLEKMIRFSDNNAAYVLTSLLGIENVKAVYDNLGVPFVVPDEKVLDNNDTDYMTSDKFSLFFQVLYNATYLNKEMSEKALQVLSETDFNDGLVAGVPADTTVSHKYGLSTIQDQTGKPIRRELHDCGIIYYPQKPYILCVMTKNNSSLLDAERTISEISALVYQEVNGGGK